jgi:hypothetical protein
VKIVAAFTAGLVLGAALSEWQFAMAVRTACAAAWAAKTGS